jgi:GTPase SAR1 family protein
MAASGSSCSTDAPLSILVLGETGSGKSSFVNSLTGLDVEISGDVDSCTYSTNVYESTFQDGSNQALQVIDTPGLGDTRGRDTENIANMVKVLRGKSIHLFCLVVNSQKRKLGATTQSMLVIFSEIFGADFLQNVVVVFTRWETGEEADEQRDAEDAWPQDWINEAFTNEVKEQLNYHGLLRFQYVDNFAAPSGDLRLRNAKQRQVMLTTIKNIRVCCEFSKIYTCMDIKEAMGMLDRVNAQLKKLRDRNQEMKVEHIRKQNEHWQNIDALRKEMDRERSEGDKRLAQLRAEGEKLRAELHEKKAREAQEKAERLQAELLEKEAREARGKAELLSLLPQSMNERRPPVSYTHSSSFASHYAPPRQHSFNFGHGVYTMQRSPNGDLTSLVYYS